MPIIKYDYFISPHIVKKELIAVYYPIISIQISGNHRIYYQPVKCLVDSGADFNLLPANIGEDLGYNIKKGERIKHTGIGNIELIAYIHPITLYLEGYKFKTEVHFSYDHKIPILGRYGFFKYFKKVTFNEKLLKLELVY